MRASKRLMAAITAGEEGVADSSERDVWVDCGMGMGRYVERNMWYVWIEERIKRHERGITARPRRFVREGAVKAWVLGC